MPAATGSDAFTAHGPADLQDLVRRCAETPTPIVSYGLAHAGVGHPPPANHVRLVQAPGQAVLEHYEQDLAVRAAAGATLGDLQAALRPSGQFIAIDADDDLPLGEIVGHHVYGALRAGYGSIRDHLLGLRFIDGLGGDVRVGGRTVKNVAGYDVTRLMVGAMGELGLVHEATLRTYAIPERVLAVDMEVDDPRAIDRVLTYWLTSDAAPAAMLLSNQTGRWVVRLAYVGRLSGAAAQLRSLETLGDRLEGVRIVGSGEMSMEQELAELALRRAWRRQAPALLKLVVPPAATGAACVALAGDGTIAARLTLDALTVHGCVFAGGSLDAHGARALDAAAGKVIAEVTGFRVWHARPAGAEALPPFAPPPSELPIMVRLKRALDPHGLFNPGRLIPLRTQEPAAS